MCSKQNKTLSIKYSRSITFVQDSGSFEINEQVLSNTKYTLNNVQSNTVLIQGFIDNLKKPGIQTFTLKIHTIAHSGKFNR